MPNCVYEPGEDSELLLEAALKEVRPEDDVIEVGAGSGFVAERIAKMCRSIVVTDVSPYAVRVLKEKGFNVVRADLFSGICEKFSLVLFNPPYLELEEELKRGDWLDVAVDGGKHGVEVIARFLEQLPDVLREGGRALIVASSQNEPYVFELIRSAGFEYEVVATRRLFFETLYAIRLSPKR
ncbi:MAG: HemK2/MTQ2 family protein methyltransferase [Archaeoglobaceae archaeon]